MEDASGTDRVRCGEIGFSGSSAPHGGWSWRGNPAGMNCCGDRLHSLECASVLSS